MPTTIVKTVGTGGRDYSTIQAAEDAKPANLVTADQIWKMECYNDSEFTAGVTISGSTTDATRFAWLTAATGQSFADHAGKATNAMRYDQTKGVGINVATAYAGILFANEPYSVVERLQFKCSSTNPSPNAAVSMFGNGAALKSSIIEYTHTISCIHVSANNASIANCLIIANGTSLSGNAIDFKYCTGGAAVNNTIVRPSDRTAGAGGIGRGGGSTGILLQNNAVFGFSSAFVNWSSGTDGASGNNATDASSAPGSSNQLSLSYSAQFESTVSSSQDFRPKSGGALPTNAVRNATYTSDLDIVAIGRSTTTPTIGAREFGGTVPLFLRILSNFPANTTRRMTVWSDTSYGTVLYNLQSVTCNSSGLFELSATGVTAGTYYPAQLTAHGANQTVQIQGTG